MMMNDKIGYCDCLLLSISKNVVRMASSDIIMVLVFQNKQPIEWLHVMSCSFKQSYF